MENASKALLIAAAILIVILLIAFGMSVMGSSSDTATDAANVASALTSQSSSAGKGAVTAIENLLK